VVRRLVLLVRIEYGWIGRIERWTRWSKEICIIYIFDSRGRRGFDYHIPIDFLNKYNYYRDPFLPTKDPIRTKI
jgi:hypothetical protein